MWHVCRVELNRDQCHIRYCSRSQPSICTGPYKTLPSNCLISLSLKITCLSCYTLCILQYRIVLSMNDRHISNLIVSMSNNLRKDLWLLMTTWALLRCSVLTFHIENKRKPAQTVISIHHKRQRIKPFSSPLMRITHA